jgi:hypothetical protein
VPAGWAQASPARKVGSPRCPYHSWTYRLEGDLLRAPWSEEIDGFEQVEVATADGSFRAGGVLLCTDVWSGDLLAQLGAELALVVT